MRTKKFTLLFFTLLLCSVTAFAQSISGKVNAKSTLKHLGYANVDIYKNDKLVANVLTDADGNFKVKLDTGTYRCEINYAGYEKITQEIKVTKDETADFGMKTDKKSKFSADSTVSYKSAAPVMMREYESVGIRSYKHSEGDMIGTADAVDADALYMGLGSIPDDVSGGSVVYSWGKSLKNDSAQSGKLTAGEINDFSKWNLWTDLNKGELNLFGALWNFSPRDRYLVQLTDEHKLPLANAKVELLNGNIVLYTGRSDNTGKAELWGSLRPDTLQKITVTSIRVNYNGEMKVSGSVKKFGEGINYFVFSTPCHQSANVDIAIVVDATGSMQDEIDYLKSDLNDVIYKSKTFSTTLNMRFANVFYRDHEDAYLTQSQDFTRVLSESVAYTNAHNADGGGDTPEAVEAGLDEAINKLSWSDDTRTKILFLVLDASPHNTLEIQEKMRKLAMEAAAKGIRIVPIAGSGAQKDTEYLMRCLALATNGTYVFLTDHSGIGGEHIAPSTDHYQVEIMNDVLVRVIKSFTYMPSCEQEIADLGVNLPSSQVVVTTVDTTKEDTAKIVAGQLITPIDTMQFKWNFYPNPTNGMVHITSDKNISELYLSDLSGKVLQVIHDIEPAKEATIDLSAYPTGIYLIRYPMGKQWESGKIVLSR
jgi:hypothetical protein